jgi:hypothetical protein
MNWRKRAPIVVGAFAALLAVTAYFATRPLKFEALVNAPGVRLTLNAIQWDMLWESASATIDLDLGNLEGRVRLVDRDLLSICETLMAKLPGAPRGVTRTMVYRVNIRKVDWYNIWVPIEVRDGTCRFDAFDGTARPTYPPRLAGWMLLDHSVEAEEGKIGLVFKFLHRGGGEGAPDEFPFALACEALLQDRILEQQDLANYLDGKFARIEMQRRTGSALVYFYRTKSMTFEVREKSCFETGTGEPV